MADTEAMSLRMHRELLRAIDEWRRREDDLPTRPEAIRRLLTLALEADARDLKRAADTKARKR